MVPIFQFRSSLGYITFLLVYKSLILPQNHIPTKSSFKCTCHSGDSNLGESVIPLVEIPIGISPIGNSNPMLKSCFPYENSKFSPYKLPQNKVSRPINLNKSFSSIKSNDLISYLCVKLQISYALYIGKFV